MSVAASTATAARWSGHTIDRLLERPRTVLGSLIGLQIGATLVLALVADHNGWVWFQGGDQIWLATQGWLLGQFELPPTELGYLWSYALTPIMWLTGPTYVQALPPLVVLQVLVLGPIALLCVYDLACRIGGRLLGYWASFLWAIAPFASIPLFVDRYQERFGEQFLPQALGLTAMSDYPSMVLVLAAAVFVARSLEAEQVHDAVLAGLLLGAATAMKPPNLLMGAGAALAYLVARRWRNGIVFGAAIVPSLLVLAFWKERGLGSIPALGLEETRLAMGAATTAISVNVDRYVDLDWDHWIQQMDYMREFFFSARVAQWAPVAGLIAVVRVRRGAVAALLAGWLGAFLVVKGFSPRADIQTGSFWRLLMPAWPAYLLLLAAIPLLIPTLARRLGERLRAPSSRPVALRWIAVAAAVTVLVPAAAIAASSPLEGPEHALTQDDAGNFILTPVDRSVELRVERTADGNLLTWEDDPWRADVFYRVYRSEGADFECENTDGHPAQSCYFFGTLVETVSERAYIDVEGAPAATYRIGVGTNWIADPAFGDVFAFSPPAVAPG
ncbi:MAG TPA: hypothetical protein VFU84_03305 [Gaiellaceae bacterium]|nr:hypothetical protein [Gaiellaceae bacterium]